MLAAGQCGYPPMHVNIEACGPAAAMRACNLISELRSAGSRLRSFVADRGRHRAHLTCAMVAGFDVWVPGFGALAAGFGGLAVGFGAMTPPSNWMRAARHIGYFPASR